MTENDEKLLAYFQIRMKQLMLLCDDLRQENQSLHDELSKKKMEMSLLSEEIEQLKIRYDNLKLVKALLGEDNVSIERSKKRLSKLVRDVDKCIALLKG